MRMQIFYSTTKIHPLSKHQTQEPYSPIHIHHIHNLIGVAALADGVGLGIVLAAAAVDAVGAKLAVAGAIRAPVSVAVVDAADADDSGVELLGRGGEDEGAEGGGDANGEGSKLHFWWWLGFGWGWVCVWFAWFLGWWMRIMFG